ncbi:hypothetical protein [Lapillicoccus jejuensis]|uniref:Uncharacterized protein n=1 Tax=Lapillicoccus jejuensis TaxID=402171 RepID=A0A542E6M0_9MICO|nr:hypothetical protein [Lapillicoccus jejuensis]TQJ10929.1 hypothetical protein FB458_4072 [Lapillicoccus jejuensis]
MTTTQAVGVALILLGVAYGIVWVGRLRRRPTEPVTQPVASEESVAPAATTSDAAPGEPVDANQGVPGRYLGTTSPDGDVAPDLARAGHATLTVADGALAWRPTRGTALRARAAELVAVDGLDAGRAAADTPVTVRWHPPAAPGTTYETRFVPTTPGGRAALAAALRVLRPDLTTAAFATTAPATSDPAPEETA